jgi:hypothetical protein
MHESQEKNDVIRNTNRLADEKIAALRLELRDLQEPQ